jgi:hypothetical protein
LIHPSSSGRSPCDLRVLSLAASTSAILTALSAPVGTASRLSRLADEHGVLGARSSSASAKGADYSLRAIQEDRLYAAYHLIALRDLRRSGAVVVRCGPRRHDRGDQPAVAAMRRAPGGLPAQDPAQRPVIGPDHTTVAAPPATAHRARRARRRAHVHSPSRTATADSQKCFPEGDRSLGPRARYCPISIVSGSLELRQVRNLRD